MERRHHGHAAELLPLPAQPRDAGGGSEQQLRRGRPQGDDDTRPDRLDLPEQERRAGRDLVRLRVAILRRPALDDVGDVDLLALETDRADHLVELLPGAADERLALRVLVGARPLADEHQVGVRIADTEHDALAGLVQTTRSAAGRLVTELHQPARSLSGARASIVRALRGLFPGRGYLVCGRAVELLEADVPQIVQDPDQRWRQVRPAVAHARAPSVRSNPRAALPDALWTAARSELRNLARARSPRSGPRRNPRRSVTRRWRR